jgi:integrase/recombinase XerD
MTPLRKRTVEEMGLRNFAPKTGELYVDNVAKFDQPFGRSPDLRGEEEVRPYLVHLVEERKLAWGTFNQALAAPRYLYRWVLRRGDVFRDIRGPRRVRHLRAVLSLDTVRRFLAADVSYNHRMILITAYSAGLMTDLLTGGYSDARWDLQRYGCCGIQGERRLWTVATVPEPTLSVVLQAR